MAIVLCIKSFDQVMFFFLPPLFAIGPPIRILTTNPSPGGTTSPPRAPLGI